MKAILEIESNELNNNLLEIINSLFNKDFTEITIKKSGIEIEEFDKTLDLNHIINSFKENGHNELFLKELEKGFQESSIYSLK